MKQYNSECSHFSSAAITHRIEPIVHQMLQILAHSDLSHQLVLVPIHSRQLTNVRENILQPIGQLERVHIVQSILNMRIDNQLRQPQNLTAQMERITEPRLLTLLRGQRFHRLQIEIVIQMQVVQVLAMDQQVQHVVALAADLQAGLDPIQRRCLEEFRRLERAEQVALLLRLRVAMLESIQHVVLEQFLVADAHFDGVTGWAVLFVPALDEWDVQRAAGATRTHVEGARRPQEGDAVGRVVGVEWAILEERLDVLVEDELFVFVEGRCFDGFDGVAMGDWVDERIEVEGRQIGILGFDVDDVGRVVPGLEF